MRLWARLGKYSLDLISCSFDLTFLFVRFDISMKIFMLYSECVFNVIYSIYFLFIRFSLIVTYLILPETDSRSLEDIELHFSDNSLSLLDRKIARTEQVAKTEANDENQNGAANEAYVPDHQK